MYKYNLYISKYYLWIGNVYWTSFFSHAKLKT